MVLIGLIGKKGVGKSTVADYLVKNHDFCEYATASPLKDICKILGAPHESVYGTQRDKEKFIPHLGVSGREMMQKIGTELFRENFKKVLPKFELGESQTIWVHLMEIFLKNNSSQNIIVSDIRFQDEADAITRSGGTLIRVVRETEEDLDLHASETMMENIIAKSIYNNSTKENLMKLVNNLIIQLNEISNKTR